ncbi:MAG TPA: PfkB family carbohydrate kinase [Thermomicrobiaceae bacterium]|nr:PfkB family carbohydrate kinase [Thermomicrobiaceae bacterium]
MDVVTCGELLVDFVASVPGATLVQAPAFEKAAGGAPANVAVGLARLGHFTGFLGQVGDDDFGRFLAGVLTENGVDTGGLRFSPEARTALAFVSLRAGGERDFLFYRHPSADMRWRAGPADLAYAAAPRVFHFGSISLSHEPSRASTLAAVAAAADAGALISYDPNLRLPLWPSAAAAREGIGLGLARTQLVKLSAEELVFLTGESDIAAGVRALWQPRFQLVTVTRGAAGAAWFSATASGGAPGFPVTAVDTTGAGDSFVAGLLAGLLEAGLRLDPDAIARAVRLGNAAGALTTTRRGAIPALPTRAAVERLLEDGS